MCIEELEWDKVNWNFSEVVYQNFIHLSVEILIPYKLFINSSMFC